MCTGMITGVCLLTALAATGKTADVATSTQPASATSPTTTAPSTVVAEFKGKTLTYGRLQMYKTYFVRPGTADQEVIDRWKLDTAMALKAEEQGLLSNSDFQNMLAIAKDRILGRFLIIHQQQHITVTDDEIRESYEKDANLPGYREPPIVTIKLIAAEKQDAVMALRKRLIDGEDFDVVMGELREQTCKLTGLSDCVIKNVSAEALRGALGSQVAALGGVRLNVPITRLISGKGYSVIFKVTERTPGELRPLEDLRDQIEQRLLRKKRSQVGRMLIEQAQKEAGVEPTPPRRPSTRRVPVRTPHRLQAPATQPKEK